MHILLVTTEFETEPGAIGGLANYMANLARILKKNGNCVSILTVSLETGKTVWDTDISVYRVRYDKEPKTIMKMHPLWIRKGILFVWNLLGRSVLVNRKIKSLKKENKIDVIHYCGTGAVALFRDKRIPAVVRVSSYAPACRKANKPDYSGRNIDCKTNVEEKVGLHAIKRGDFIFAPSKLVAKLTQLNIGKEVFVIESPFWINKNKIDYSIYYDKLNEKKYFLFYGMLSYLKGVHTIAGGLKDFFDNNPQHFFVFIGNMSYMNINDKVVTAMEYVRTICCEYNDRILYFPSMRNKEQLYGIIERAEGCVLPSRFDNLPNTCIEAMALGQIVIGTKGASFDQLIEDGINGFLIEMEDSRQMVQQMNKVIKLTQAERKEISKNASQITQRLDGQRIYEQVINIYNQAIKKGR